VSVVHVTGPDTKEYGLVKRPTFVDLSGVLLCPRSRDTASAPAQLESAEGEDAMAVDPGSEEDWEDTGSMGSDSPSEGSEVDMDVDGWAEYMGEGK